VIKDFRLLGNRSILLSFSLIALHYRHHRETMLDKT
jgi:hypothetical protein